jgi:hypothetical protein
MNEPINLTQKLALFDERFSPRIVTTMNDYKIEEAKVEGDFVWHSHPDTDEFFLMLEGELEIELRDRKVRPRKATCSSCHTASNIVPAPTTRHTPAGPVVPLRRQLPHGPSTRRPTSRVGDHGRSCVARPAHKR